MRRFLPTLLLAFAIGCQPAASLPPVVYPNDATQLTAEAFIEQATGQEWAQEESYGEFGFPRVQDGEGGTLHLLYGCRDQSVGLTVDRAKFNRGIIDVVEAEAY